MLIGSPPKRIRSADRKNDLPEEIPETPARHIDCIDTTRIGDDCDSSPKLIGQFLNMNLDAEIETETTTVGLEADGEEGGGEEEESGADVDMDGIQDENFYSSVNVSALSSPKSEDCPRDSSTQAHGRKRLKSPPPPLPPRRIVAEEEDGLKVSASAVFDDDDELSSDPEECGITYAPTPTQRYLRSQKRMQQIKEYKARESKEARERRTAERRRRKSMSRTAAAVNTNTENTGGLLKKKSVHFHLS